MFKILINYSVCWEWFFFKKIISLGCLFLEFNFLFKKWLLWQELNWFHCLSKVFLFTLGHFILSILCFRNVKKRLKHTIKIGSSYSNNDNWYWVFRSLKYKTSFCQYSFPSRKNTVNRMEMRSPNLLVIDVKYFQVIVSFLYPLKTSENLWCSVFREHKKGIFSWGLIQTYIYRHFSTKQQSSFF